MENYLWGRNFSNGRINIDLTLKKEAAYWWRIRQRAADEAQMLNVHDIYLETEEGLKLIRENFQVEELASNKFIVCLVSQKLDAA